MASPELAYGVVVRFYCFPISGHHFEAGQAAQLHVKLCIVCGIMWAASRVQLEWHQSGNVQRATTIPASHVSLRLDLWYRSLYSLTR